MLIRSIDASCPGLQGDPTRVTIGGQSSGSSAVCTLAVSAPAAGLFNRLVSESGPCIGPWQPLPTDYGRSITHFIRSPHSRSHCSHSLTHSTHPLTPLTRGRCPPTTAGRSPTPFAHRTHALTAVTHSLTPLTPLTHSLHSLPPTTAGRSPTSFAHRTHALNNSPTHQLPALTRGRGPPTTAGRSPAQSSSCTTPPRSTVRQHLETSTSFLVHFSHISHLCTTPLAPCYNSTQ